jgi:uncharacterized membrane protein
MIATESFVQVLHILAAGTWLGGVVFTSTVVTPAFKRMEWTPAERMAVRSAVGRQYSKVARANLGALLALAIIALALNGGALAMAEIILVALSFFLAELHANYYAPRLAQAAREQAHELRQRLLRVSISVSMLNLLLSVGIAVLAVLVWGRA